MGFIADGSSQKKNGKQRFVVRRSVLSCRWCFYRFSAYILDIYSVCCVKSWWVFIQTQLLLTHFRQCFMCSFDTFLTHNIAFYSAVLVVLLPWVVRA